MNSKKVKKLIAKGELNDAIALLMETINEKTNAHEKAVLISMRIHILEDAVIGGRISWEDESKEKNQLAYCILKLLKKL